MQATTTRTSFLGRLQRGDVLIADGLWSQYLEVGIGPDAEIFTRAQHAKAA